MTAAMQRLEPSHSWRPLSLDEHKAIEREGQPWWEDREAEKALRGYRLAQEIVDRHSAEASGLRHYVEALEAHIAATVPGFELTPVLVLLRCMALSEPLPVPAERHLRVAA